MVEIEGKLAHMQGMYILMQKSTPDTEVSEERMRKI